MLCLSLYLPFIDAGMSSSAVLASGAESDQTGIESGGGGGIDGEAKADAPCWLLQRATQKLMRRCNECILDWVYVM